MGVYLSLLGRLIDEANREKNNTKMKSLVKERDTLCDAGLWLRIVGYIQIFSVIVELSEFSQSSSAFCTSVIEKYKECKSKLESLGIDLIKYLQMLPPSLI